MARDSFDFEIDVAQSEPSSEFSSVQRDEPPLRCLVSDCWREAAFTYPFCREKHLEERTSLRVGPSGLTDKSGSVVSRESGLFASSRSCAVGQTIFRAGSFIVPILGEWIPIELFRILLGEDECRSDDDRPRRIAGVESDEQAHGWVLDVATRPRCAASASALVDANDDVVRFVAGNSTGTRPLLANATVAWCAGIRVPFLIAVRKIRNCEEIVVESGDFSSTTMSFFKKRPRLRAARVVSSRATDTAVSRDGFATSSFFSFSLST